jgi:hypothetical protein
MFKQNFNKLLKLHLKPASPPHLELRCARVNASVAWRNTYMTVQTTSKPLPRTWNSAAHVSTRL